MDLGRIILVLLLVAIIALAGFMAYQLIDQMTGQSTVYHGLTVVDKAHSSTLIIWANGFPQTIESWTLSFQYKGKTLTGEVNPSCYSKINKGDKLDVKVTYGKKTVGVSPICP